MKVVGVTLGWTGRPQLAWKIELPWWNFWDSDIRILPYYYEVEKYVQYYPDGYGTWPKDPTTGEKLEIYE